jgi:hypothetical protein
MWAWLSGIALGIALLLTTLAYLEPGFMVGLSNLIVICF